MIEEQDRKDPAGEDENFADMLEAFSQETDRELRVGDRIKGEIISIGKDAVFVSTGAKVDGYVEKTELIDENGEFLYQVGDEIELYVAAWTENEIQLSRALSGAGGLELLKEAFRNQVPVEGKVKGQNKGGFDVEVFKRRAFCPISQMDTRYIEQPADYVGETLPFLITRLEDNGRNIVLSRRDYLSRIQEEQCRAFLAELQPGQVVEAMITRLAPFGAFAELCPGLEGMVHISELGWSRVEKPEDVVSTGKSVRVKVIGVSREGEKTKISLSMKQAQEDPWKTVGERFHAGQKVSGVVTRVAPFGAFVEIAPGLEGLVHISEMSYERRVVKAEEVARPGDTVPVLVKEIDPQKRRISLSIKDVEGDPWLEVADRFAVGQAVTGTLEKKESFGLFVSLAPGITGLLPASKLKRASQPEVFDKVKPGEPLPVKIAEIQPLERKITLEPSETAVEENWQDYARESSKSLGSLGEKLARALQKQEKK